VIPRECRRLAEVDFPIGEVSRHAVREKSIRHGHPSTLHLWWARRPLASSRAMLLALLLPDPCDAMCPPEFLEAARSVLAGMDGAPQRWKRELQTDAGLRQILLRFIANFANWDNAAAPAYLNLSVGAHGALRIAQLRGRDSAVALAVAVQEERPKTGFACRYCASPRGGGGAICGAQDIRAEAGQRSGWRHGGACQSDLSLLPHGAAAGSRAGATFRSARRRGCGVQ